MNHVSDKLIYISEENKNIKEGFTHNEFNETWHIQLITQSQLHLIELLSKKSQFCSFLVEVFIKITRLLNPSLQSLIISLNGFNLRLLLSNGRIGPKLKRIEIPTQITKIKKKQRKKRKNPHDPFICVLQTRLVNNLCLTLITTFS